METTNLPDTISTNKELINSEESDNEKTIQIFRTEDTVDVNNLAKLGNSVALKRMLQNRHLRDFLTKLDEASNAWKAMKLAMYEPLFIEFADECLKIIEPEEKS